MSTQLGFYDSRVQIDGGDQKSTLTLSSEFTVTKTATDGAVAMGALNHIRAAQTASTIATGVVAYATPWHLLETEGAAATDDLDKVTGGTLGDILILSDTNSGHDVTVKHAIAADKFCLAAGADFTLDTTTARIVFLHDGTQWFELCRATNHA